MQIYLARNNEQAGPYSLDQLNKMLASEQVLLTDLMWHDGMDNWLPISQVTGGMRYYSGSASQSESTVSTPFANTSVRTPTAQQQGVNLGKTATPQAAKQSPNVSSHSLISRDESGLYPLASVGTRILAVVINHVLLLLALLPIFTELDVTAEEIMQVTDLTAYMALFEGVSQTNLVVTGLLVLALFAIQLVLLARRGQSLGKLATHVRVLDRQTHRVPAVLNIVGLRTILTNIAYNLPVVGLFILLGDFLLLFIDKEHRSLHDKLANTYVAKASADQIQTD